MSMAKAPAPVVFKATLQRHGAAGFVELPFDPKTVFGKVRAPVSITLTSHHHTKVDRNMKRLGLTRSDFIALLIDRYGDHVSLEESHSMCPECGQVDAVEDGACRFCKAVLPPGTHPPARP